MSSTSSAAVIRRDIAHEFLAADNHAYWRSDFMRLVRAYGFDYVVDADFNYSRPAARYAEPRLRAEGIIGRSLDDTVDLLCYRQLHSPILTPAPLARSAVAVDAFANLDRLAARAQRIGRAASRVPTSVRLRGGGQGPGGRGRVGASR